MKRVIHFITGLGIGGAERVLMNLTMHMDNVRFSNLVISLTGKGQLGSHLEASGIRVFHLEINSLHRTMLPLRRLAAIIRDQRPDVIQTWMYHADLLGSIAGSLFGIPVIWNIRCAQLNREDHPRLLFWLRRFLALMSRFPLAIVVNSTEGRIIHEKLGYRPRRWALIRNGVDTDRFMPNPLAGKSLRDKIGLAGNVPIVGMVARFHPMKDHITFLKAAALLTKLESDTFFVLVGNSVDENNSKFKRLIDSYNLQGRIRLLGERPDVEKILPAFTVATISSYSEGFPNVIVEAMSCGVPCVATEVGDVATILGSTGIVVEPRNPKALAAAWRKILSLTKEEHQAYGKAARQRVTKMFSVQHMVRQYEDLYEAVLQ